MSSAIEKSVAEVEIRTHQLKRQGAERYRLQGTAVTFLKPYLANPSLNSTKHVLVLGASDPTRKTGSLVPALSYAVVD